MKFLHISDLHIGKRVNEFSMTEDQKYILGQILHIAESEHVDAVLIAGDVYDKPVPSAEAVQVLDWFLTELADRGKTVFAVAGNHDSPERIAFGARLMKKRGVYLSPVYRGEAECIQLADDYGEICIYLLPFVKPSTVRHAIERLAFAERQRSMEKEDFVEKEHSMEGGYFIQEELSMEEDLSTEEEYSMEEGPATYQEAVKIAVDRMKIDDTKRNILVAHQFVTGAGRCDSEEVSVGGLDNVDAEVFCGFDYVALGHIHSPQSVKRESVRYCGTPLKYSFSEAGQEKSVTILEMREKGQMEISQVPLKPLHDMRRIRGSYLEVTQRQFYQAFDREDYVQVTLTDEEDVPDGLQKLRIIYPNLMRLVYDNSRTRQDRDVETVQAVAQKSELTLFGEFYELQNNQPMSEEQTIFVKHVIERLGGTV